MVNNGREVLHTIARTICHSCCPNKHDCNRDSEFPTPNFSYTQKPKVASILVSFVASCAYSQKESRNQTNTIIPRNAVTRWRGQVV